jgi:acyl-CoA oxidase
MFAQGFALEHVKEKYEKLLKGIDNEDFSLLDLMHHYTAGMKAVYTQETFDGLISIRQCLGGAGYSAWSGIPRWIDDYSPLVTFEGDNTVMA